MKFFATWPALLLVLLSVSPSGAHPQIPLIVEERTGLTRTNEPVTLGVPFARGTLLPTQPLRVLDPSGTPIAAQFRPMATWDDGSIKWLKGDFQASVSAHGTATYQLESGPTPAPGTALNVLESGDAITVTTGPLRFVVSKTRFNLFDQAWLDLDGNRQFSVDEEIISPGASEGPLVTASGVVYRATGLPPEHIEVEEQGPLKVVIKASGRHYAASGFLLKYETRLYAYAGHPFVRIRHVYANGTSVGTLGDANNPAFGASLDRYTLAFHLNLAGEKTVHFGGERGRAVTLVMPPSGQVRLQQNDRSRRGQPFEYAITRDGVQAATGSRAEGWASLVDDTWGVLASSRYFWQKNPKGVLLADDGTLAVELAPSPTFLWAGMGTGDDVLLYFHTAAETSLAPVRAMALSKNPLFARTSPEHYVQSGALYALRPGPSPYPAMDDYLDLVTTNHLANREALGLYGNLHFGDVPRGQYEVADELALSAWGNNYYDALLTSARLFAQSGDLRQVDIIVPMAWHFMETAAWNTYDPNDWMNGYAPAYSANHREIGHFQHHYGEGLWYYYYLTGDERAREVGLRAAESIVEQQAWGNANVDARMAYQRASAALEAWKNTRDERFLRHARHLLVDKMLATQDRFGLVGGSMDEGGNRVTPEQTFMLALFSDTVWKYLQEDPDPDAIARLARLADMMDHYARKQPGQEEYWNFMSIPTDSQPPNPDQDPNNPDATVYWFGKGLIAGTYAYAYHLTGDLRYRTLARDLLDDFWATIDFEGSEFWGKASCQAMKNVLHAVAIVSEEAVGTALERFEEDALPTHIVLSQNYPNPFNPSTTIPFVVPRQGRVRLAVYDLLGRELVVLASGSLSAGSYAVRWDALDAGGQRLPSGLYLYRLTADGASMTKRMVLIK